ncbi:type III-A CRISPR-associated protein Cas10/Csm1 [Fibrisoma montanum]|uniref:CRISPR system single-strand-specific deoxyribonuclease Cas10/Csm1 (subtype III-A) n=1 Tax=Fibrisoma montanum TaxID=2305895 RepID=A0A418MFJ5_9BACT|nr:type III-A CRISPR-associated protein Cas10/Csm1 [Fibrisoma montanum]RIV25578.1 type III-A CRISPR-associated protein Cas10/Csm1 [Fibrisoma montanum]
MMSTEQATPTDKTRELVYLAGLLHDIGKFYQRADPDGAPKSKWLEDREGLEKALCPTDKNGRYTHKHVLWTYQFFTTFKDLFADALTSQQTAKLARLAAAHHHPDATRIDEKIIQLADHYSSGIDRTTESGLVDEYAEQNKEGSGNWDDFKKMRMVSVFETLFDAKVVRHRLPIASVSLTQSFFPQLSADDFDQSAPQQYYTLWNKFADELTTLSKVQNRPRTVSALTDTLFFLLEKYVITVPSSTQHLPDVSLYDHLKSTAALSLCLYDYLDEKNQLSRLAIEPDEAPLLMIGGDLSGIQAFIYDIIGRSAAKNLKGRSFYLQLMLDSIVQYLLDGLKLKRANIVYSSGGGFYLLAPNTRFTRDTLLQLQQEIAAKLRDEQGVKLFLAIDCQPVTQNQLYGKDKTIGDVWSGLTEKLAAQKKRRFALTLATSDYAYFFEPSEVGGESRNSRDAITGEEFRPDEKTGKREKDYPIGPADDEREANQRVRKPTFEQIRLGRTLRENVKYVVKVHQPISYWEPDEPTFGERTDRHFNPLSLNQYYYFIGEKQLDKFKSLAKGSVDSVLIQSVNTAETTGFQLSGTNQTYGFTLYGGNTIPRDSKGEPKYFEELTGADTLNFKRLGVLRMDVDNLGFLFKNGFSDGKRTFSRYSTLSRSLDYFFKGYLNQIREQDDDFREYTFILYAGGDDLFIVGKWDVTLRFAERIQAEFAAWTCHSNRMGISGGIAVVPPKFPIAKAADQSADEEKRAKNHDLKDSAGKVIQEKNSMSLFGTPLGWGANWKVNNGLSEWQIVTELKENLKQHIGGEKSIPKSLISKIGTLYSMQQEQAKNQQNPSWRWLSAYDLGRARERAKSKEAKDFFDQLKTDLFTNRTYRGQPLTGTNYDFLTLLNVAARWAELEMRSEDKSNND